MTATRLESTSPRRGAVSLALLALLSAALLFLTGCRTNREADELKSGPTLVYERARKSLDNQDFDSAIRVYEALVARFPFAPECESSAGFRAISRRRFTLVSCRCPSADSGHVERPSRQRVHGRRGPDTPRIAH